MVLAVPALSQGFPNGLAYDSVDPSRDSVAFAQMRARMDSIHRTQHRPTVGLVLSGGGAKGSAHVGVLKYLEEIEMPVDLICGTSMGGLVAGVTALGYSPDFTDSLFRAQDWAVMLSDHIDRKYFSYEDKIYKETFQLSLPFMYDNKDFQRRIDEQMSHLRGDGNYAFGQNSLMNSLPAGFVNGLNVNNLFSSVSTGYEDDMPFIDLPIPFFCVAADMVTLKAKIWTDGDITKALRSTMSIPGFFSPVRTDGMVLVDGGVINNFPVDIARAMGCDIVIGVDLSSARRGYSKVNNIVDMAFQFTEMPARASFNRNVHATDIHIRPDVTGFRMLSFTHEAIDSLIARGYVAAKAKSEELLEIKKLVGSATTVLSARPATDVGAHPVMVSDVDFTGVSFAESRRLRREIRFSSGMVDKESLLAMLSDIQATGAMESVTYRLLGEEEPYTLVFDCIKGPSNQLGVSVRLDNEEWASFLFHLGLNTHKLSGVMLDVKAKVGTSQWLTVRGSANIDFLPTLNLEASVSNVNSSVYLNTDSAPLGARFWGHEEKLFLSNIDWRQFDFSLGIRNRYSRLASNSVLGEAIGGLSEDRLEGMYAGLFATSTLYTQDRLYYPERGVTFKLAYGYDFHKAGASGFRPIHTAAMNFSGILPLGARVALVPELYLRAVIGSDYSMWSGDEANKSYSLMHQNYVGGFMADRYIEGQVPFVGFGDVYIAKPYMAVAQMGLRVRIADRFYTTATGGYFREELALPDFLTTALPTLWGAGLEFGYASPAGPIRVVGNWSNRTGDWRKDFGLYISLGYNF